MMKNVIDILRKFLCMGLLLFGLEASATDKDSTQWRPTWGVELTSEQQVTHTGKYNFANLLRLQASLPIYKGLSADIGSLSTYMSSKESIGQDLQTFSNLDAGNIPFTLSLLGLNWNISEGGHMLFLGIRNMNEDYFCSPVTSFFTNSSCGIFPTISANYPVANYPLSSVGVHYRYQKAWADGEDSPSSIALQVSLYNGTGYRRFTGRENMFRFCPEQDGIFGLVEATYSHKGSSVFLGSALRQHDGFSSTPWIYAEQEVTDRLSLVAGYSHAFASEADCHDFAGLGGTFAWEGCTLGLFTDYARFAEGDEFATELSCDINLTSFLSLRPSVHIAATDGHFRSMATLRIGLSF